MLDELLPCPFCGGTPKVSGVISEYKDDFSGFVVMCEVCGCGTTAFTARDKAVSVWNNRVPSDNENKLVKVLSSLVDAHYDSVTADAMHTRAVYQANELLKAYAD